MELGGLHLVALDNPAPPDYGGAIDMYYKILALKAVGAKVYLHVFHKKGRRKNLDAPLLSAVDAAFFYPRKRGLLNLLNAKPYAVITRTSKDLLQNLQNDSPVLFEGAHTTAQLQEIKDIWPDRTLALRGHNIEARYYQELRNSETNPLKRAFCAQESRKFRAYEPFIYKSTTCSFSISPAETEIARTLRKKAYWLPAFFCERLPALSEIEFKAQNPSQNKAIRLLFHANFEVAPNIKAAQWLAQHTPRIPCLEIVFAGKQAAGINTTAAKNDVQIVNNPGDKMDDIIERCDLVVLPGKQKSGVKLKLLRTIGALKPVIASPETLHGSGLEQIIPSFATGEELAVHLERWRDNPLVFVEQLAKALDYLQDHYHPEQNALFLINEIKKAAE